MSQTLPQAKLRALPRGNGGALLNWSNWLAPPRPYLAAGRPTPPQRGATPSPAPAGKPPPPASPHHAVPDRSMARRTRAAQLVWRAYVITVASMCGTLSVFGGYLLSMGLMFQGGVTVGSAVMMLALLLIAWLAKGMMAPEL